MTFPPISITTSTPFDFRWTDFSLKENTTGLLEVYVNPSSADVYYGDLPGPAITVLNYTSGPVTGQTYLEKKTSASTTLTPAPFGWNDIKPGYVLTCADDAADDGKYVVAVEGRQLKFNTNLAMGTPAGFTLVFTPPAISSTNGQPILQGTRVSFLADKTNAHLEQPIRFVVASGTAIVRMRYKLLNS